MTDLVLFPNCDLHVAVGTTPTPPLRLEVALRSPHPLDPTRHQLTPVTSMCTFEFFAPYRAPGDRIGPFLPTVAVTGLVTPGAPGVYLFQVRYAQSANVIHYLVGRLQVHGGSIVDWWFGNSTITTALDPDIAQSQPSIYASFEEHVSGTDIVGDITGHGYVSLTSTDQNLFTVDSNGRLKGLAVTPLEGRLLEGQFLNTTRRLPVHVVNYDQPRQDLVMVRSGASADPNAVTADAHHLLLLGEGFLDTEEDRERFDQIVEEVVDGLFTKPRHSPFDLLSDRFYVWKAFAPSRQRGLTCGFQVTDESVPGLLPRGLPIPSDLPMPVWDPEPDRYTPAELIRRVGLPLWNESRARTLVEDLWSIPEMQLPGFDRTKFSPALYEAWTRQSSYALIEARDTFLGLHNGGRPGDRSSGLDRQPVARPSTDTPSDALRAFVARVYEFFDFSSARAILPDRRRHPPELFTSWWGDSFPGSSFMRYVTGLSTSDNPSRNIGPEWVPMPGSNHLRRSVGLVGVICNDEFGRGASFCDSTAFGLRVGGTAVVRFNDVVTGTWRLRLRNPLIDLSPRIQNITDVFVHELGHSLNLGDEYEERAGDDPLAINATTDHSYDNVTRWGWARLSPPVGPPSPTDRRLDPDRVKWLTLMRPRLSSALTSDAVVDQGPPRTIMVRVDPDHVEAWRAAKGRNAKAYLQAASATDRQLPIPSMLPNLTIDLVRDDGRITLALPAAGTPPQFAKNSLLFVPRERGGVPALVTENEVLARLTTSKLPLNRDPDVSTVNHGPDIADDIADFEPPSHPYRLIGVYEGAMHAAGFNYRPAGMCKMRSHHGSGESGEFCHVCKYVIVNRIDPNVHALLDARYFPEAEKRSDGWEANDG